MFYDGLRLPIDVEINSISVPGYNTSVTVLAGGAEKRNQNFEQPRSKFEISYDIMMKTETIDDVLSMFHFVSGRAHSFRFRDWNDYQIGNNDTDTPQTIGTGDGAETDFPIVRRYTTSVGTFDRTVELVDDTDFTPRVFLDGIEQGSGYTIANATISFTVPPADSVLVGVICDFDIAVRFDTDELAFNVFQEYAGSIPSVPLIEVRGEV